MGSQFLFDNELPQPEARDYSRPTLFNLAKERPNKTIDIGYNGVSVSSEPYGGILQLSVFHPEHGIIVASPFEQFDGTKYHEPTYVRQYRARMLQMLKDGQPGFGLRLPRAARSSEQVSVEFTSLGSAVMRFSLDDGVNASYRIDVNPDGSLSQRATISNESSRLVDIPFELNLCLSVHRASYGQLTEGGPIPLPPSENHLQLHGNGGYFTVSNRFLGARMHGCLDLNGSPVTLDGLQESTEQGRPLAAALERTISLAPNAKLELAARFELSPDTGSAKGQGQSVAQKAAPRAAEERDWHQSEKLETYIVRRNLDYILGNCTVPVSDDAVAVITDHVALPLGWNRDNYWQWKFLLVTRRHLDSLVTPSASNYYRTAMDHTIRGHLNWVFRLAQRPHKLWHRSYVVTGRPKDGPVFQLDQQCYPFVELCDYLDEFPGSEEFVESLIVQGSAGEVLDLIKSKCDPETGLFPTDETPGDDAVEHPFHFSSHLLLWYTFGRLSKLFRALGPAHEASAEEFGSLAEKVRREALRHFIVTDEATGQPIIAYLTDGQGQHTLYHDANDIPTVFAPAWGFLTTPDELAAWHNTMRFAASKRNQGGFASGGPFAGLGSVHSKGAWPLGYFQELMYARATGDEAARQDTWRRIAGAMQWDGTFGEAVSVETAVTTSKAWFSWPGSMLGAALVEDLAGVRGTECL